MVILSAGDLAGAPAREYLRVSKDRTGNLQSPADQHAENADDAARNGWALGDPYAEPAAVSASRWSKVVRAEFESLVADIASGRFGARILILWQSDRGGRSVKDWIRLVDACEEAGILIYVTTHKRLYDAGNARDRRSLLEDAVDSEYDNSKRRAAVIRGTAGAASRGEPHGRVPYGYRRVYDPLTRRLLRQEVHPEEAAVVRDLFARVVAGQSMRSIAIDFAARGIRTRGTVKHPPRPFTNADLRVMALNPTYAGLRTHHPGGKGTPRRKVGSLDGAVKGTWPAIIGEEDFHSARALLMSPARRNWRPGGAKHLLSLIALCDVCEGPLTAEYREGVRQYVCRDASHVRVDADDLDVVALIVIAEFLSREDTAASLRRAAGAVPELGQVRAELLTAEEELADWRERAARREVKAASFVPIEAAIDAEITRLKEKERRLLTPSALAPWTGTPREVAGKLDGATVEALRTLARAVLSPEGAGPLLVLRIGKGRKVPASDRFRLGPVTE
jgi:site-specific DNA recombinase